jgi:hypothetical protein
LGRACASASSVRRRACRSNCRTAMPNTAA